MQKNTSSPGKQNVAGQIVDIMAGAGIKHLYAITGDSLNALTDALTADGRIRFIHVRHEESAAFAASAEAQLTGRLAACGGSSGPGHVHLVNGLYDAQRSSAPVLAIASTCPSALYGTEYFQETNPTLLFSNCSLYNQTAVTPEQVPHMFQAAMQEALSKGGVGVVGLPSDVTTLPAASSYAASEPFATERMPEPDPEKVGAVAALLNRAAKTVIFAGSGARGAARLLSELSDKLKAPVITTYKSQLELMGSCRGYVGHVAFLGTWAASDALADADVILMIGTNFPYPGFFPTDRKIIQVDVRAGRLGRKAKVDIGLRADAKLFLESLLPLVAEKSDSSFLDKALADYATIQEKYTLPVKNPGVKGKIRPEFMLHTLNRLAAADAIFTVDTGMNNLWTAHYLTPGAGRVMIGSFVHGSMANAMPMAIGAACACPDRQIIAICGDGGFSMLLGELLTIVQYGLPVKLLVADNRSLAFVQWEMELAGLTPSQTSLVNPDFGELARAAGMQAETVTDPAALEAAMERWLKAEGPALLSVTTDADAASFSFSRELMDKAAPGNPVSNFLPLGS